MQPLAAMALLIDGILSPEGTSRLIAASDPGQFISDCTRPRHSGTQQGSQFRTPRTQASSGSQGGSLVRGGAQSSHGGSHSSRGGYQSGRGGSQVFRGEAQSGQSGLDAILIILSSLQFFPQIINYSLQIIKKSKITNSLNQNPYAQSPAAVISISSAAISISSRGYFGILKSYVRNRACPEGSIAEAYIANKCLTFCARYLEGGDSRSYWSRKSDDEIENLTDREGCLFPSVGEPCGVIDVFDLDDKTWLQAHRHILFNCESEVVENYKNEHIAEIKRLYRKSRLRPHQLERLHFDTFHEWFKEQVKELEDTSNIPKDVLFLAKGPAYVARRFNEFNINNGYRFRTKQCEEFMKTQNSDVMVVSKTESYASTSDNAPKSANITYYGRLNDIMELNYYEEFKVVLFKCDWVDVTKGRGVKEDELGFTLVNFSHFIDSGNRGSDEPFIFANQAQQVIFVQDPKDREWFVPRPIKPRDIFDMGEKNSMQFESSMQSDATDLIILENVCDTEYECNDWVRSDVDGIEIHVPDSQTPPNKGEADVDGGNDIEDESDNE
ncbi:uncharacterized protein LOC132639574 [Lycium barbarum]|uniref:uncharacterized protein LOC132639574 n=1 Tax=Lycium barbarum TaxID=112863 RepID=UPI00293F60BB|nr:uncharacterized protein LOC132639574 [Lycium barbarum]